MLAEFGTRLATGGCIVSLVRGEMKKGMRGYLLGVFGLGFWFGWGVLAAIRERKRERRKGRQRESDINERMEF